jgi:hypothetical protein
MVRFQRRKKRGRCVRLVVLGLLLSGIAGTSGMGQTSAQERLPALLQVPRDNQGLVLAGTTEDAARDPSAQLEQTDGVTETVLGNGTAGDWPMGLGSFQLLSLEMAPGAILPSGMEDPAIGLVAVIEGEIVVEVEAPIVVARQDGTSEEIESGREATLRPGDSFVFPAFVAGDVRNNADSTARVLLSLVAPLENADAGVQVAETPVTQAPSPTPAAEETGNGLGGEYLYESPQFGYVGVWMSWEPDVAQTQSVTGDYDILTLVPDDAGEEAGETVLQIAGVPDTTPAILFDALLTDTLGRYTDGEVVNQFETEGIVGALIEGTRQGTRQRTYIEVDSLSNPSRGCRTEACAESAIAFVLSGPAHEAAWKYAVGLATSARINGYVPFVYDAEHAFPPSG